MESSGKALEEQIQGQQAVQCSNWIDREGPSSASVGGRSGEVQQPIKCQWVFGLMCWNIRRGEEDGCVGYSFTYTHLDKVDQNDIGEMVVEIV